jgi:hypothetical protein
VMTMLNIPSMVVLSVCAAALPTLVNAHGCIKGAAVGGLVGHVAGHHAVAGAAIGCAVAHHQAKVKEKEAAQARAAQTPAAAQGGAPARSSPH